jgi:hypothetical protein
VIETLVRPGQATELSGSRDWEDDVRRRVGEIDAEDPTHWDFRIRNRHEAPPRFFQYPAMMVAEVQRAVLGMIKDSQPSTGSLVDPFAGSGTTLTEAMRLGLSAVGQDINPLAVLLASIATEITDPELLASNAEAVLRRSKTGRSLKPAIPGESATKWFRPSALADLGTIAFAIRQLPDVKSRRFFWAAIAETVRLCSNSRTSTYKLHIRPADQIARLPSVRVVFQEVVERNLGELRRFRSELTQRGQLSAGAYSGSIVVRYGDSRIGVGGKYDVLVTSPPYGDNATTVPYGQASYLPLAWIDFGDIAGNLPKDLLDATLRIDRRSLGGSLPRGSWRDYAASSIERSATLRECLDALEALPRDRPQRVATFIADLDATIDPIIGSIRPGAPMIWTVGNRRVGSLEVPLTTVLEELLVSRGCRSVARIQRRISGKRMAVRNSVAATMRSEHVLVIRGPL